MPVFDRDELPWEAVALPTSRGTLRLRFRDPRSLDEAAADVAAGLGTLDDAGVTRVALVGPASSRSCTSSPATATI